MPVLATPCLHCRQPIKAGRSDKKFCDTGCKDAYYNAAKSQEHREVKKIDAVLKKNRRILKRIFNPQKGESLVRYDQLVKSGFDFTFYTHHVITKTRSNEFIFCYDYGYRELGNGFVKVVKAF